MRNKNPNHPAVHFFFSTLKHGGFLRAGVISRWLLMPVVVGSLLGGADVSTGAPERKVEAPSSVLAHWTFDADKTDGTVVQDSGPNGYHGNIQSQKEIVPETVPGIRGEALNFPSGHESWVELDRRLTLRPPFTIAAWVRISARRATMELIGQKSHVAKEGLRLIFSTRHFFFEYGDGSENVEVRYDPHQTKQGQWAFVAVTHDEKEIAIYVDGEEFQRVAARPGRWSKKPLLLGNYVNQKNEYRFLGTMDEIIILEKALNGREIARLGQWMLEH